MSDLTRCNWSLGDDLYLDYHDKEWGAPLHDDGKLFEFLVLEGAQAGLSWITVLKKRAAYRQAFDDFDYMQVAEYDESKVRSLLADPGIIRNELKIRSAIRNARAFIRVREEFGSFDNYIWNFVDGKPIQNAWQHGSQIPAETPLSNKISKDLKRRGFNFVGPTIIYAHMQATGMVNDHTTDCFRYGEIKALSG
ncbi:MAG: DNA-3-methyladenine glycosylase I [Gammaproteobacteria bacterium]|nr:DNA-3-methyladenine glycosylase I [Gammaproteobacteria bacterium]MDE0284044.1 DNA-3-methyladenine glycosylase I [Gammaproteobacteria bacterium]MDE0511367.1 DNA-3-methyladenine glycosylase I [Gammaproteobacteria bacterium]